MKKNLKKYICNILTFALTAVACGAATANCFFMFYQPKAPENLNKFSKN